MFALSVGSSTAVAAVVDGLFEASVAVADQSAAERNRAFAAALEVVLVKNTGERGVARSPDVSELLASAPRLVQQFRYERRDEPAPEGEGTVTTLYLSARFDPGAILGALAERGIPIWGRERPLTLVWLAFDAGTERGIVDESADPMFVKTIRDTARERGLPIVMPLMDLEDRSTLGFAELWGGFDDSVIEASVRYGANAILIGRVFRVDDERWAARWTLIEDGSVDSMETPAGAINVVVADGLHLVADRFADRFALVPDTDEDGRTRVSIVGVAGIGDYAAVTRYLRELSVVAGVQVESVDGDAVTFTLELRGTREQLEQAIALDRRLTAAPEDFGSVTLGLRYLFNRR